MDSASVLIIYGIPSSKSSLDAETEIRAKLDECREVADIYVVPDYTKAYVLRKEREENKEALIKYQILNEREEKR
jgi:hypothetical protein